MGPLSISLIVDGRGDVTARAWRGGAAEKGERRVDLTGLDGRVLRVFERWLMVPDRSWDREDIQVFGRLLHRKLFSGKLWDWVERRLGERGDELLRLQLAFPIDAASSRLATLPWEFLCDPEDRFLVLTPGLMLSRSLPPGVTARRTAATTDVVRVLPVVGETESDWLGPVDYEPVLEALATVDGKAGIEILEPEIQVTAAGLATAVAHTRPHVLHYIGHGRFDERSGKGAVALKGEDGATRWVDEDDLADRLCTPEWTPTVVVLHACEGGSTDYEYRYAGLAPTLVRRGVHSVVAMQYPLTNETANLFSTTLYDALAREQYLDEAVQTARHAIWDANRDARLLGVPMIYQQNAAALLGPAAGKDSP